MANNNTLILIGNLGQDPATYTRDGKPFTRLSIATTDSYKDRSTGTWKQRKPIWHTVFINLEKAQEAAQQFKKGDRVKLTGSLSYRRIKVTEKGHSGTFTEASIAAYKIEAAPLAGKSEEAQQEETVAA